MTMNTITLTRDKIHEGELILVNAVHPLYRERTEEPVPVNARYPDIRLNRKATGMLQALLERLAAENEIVPVSGYRSHEEQTEIYRKSLKENGAEFTRKYVALPDRSEHQTGLAIDVGRYLENIDFLCPDFPYEGICEEFRRLAPDYGFIQRYPAGKEKITGIAHEPWHFRYVGFPHSAVMADMGLTLEEYIAFIKRYSPERRLIYRNTEVFFFPAAAPYTEIRLPEDALYQVSGNNTDGFIVTVWGESR